MTKLEEIFLIGDPTERLKELLAYAKVLRIDLSKAKKPNGDYSENVLAVLMSEVERSRHANKSSKVGFAVAVAFIALAILAAIWLFNVMTAGG